MKQSFRCFVRLSNEALKIERDSEKSALLRVSKGRLSVLCIRDMPIKMENVRTILTGELFVVTKSLQFFFDAGLCFLLRHEHSSAEDFFVIGAFLWDHWK